MAVKMVWVCDCGEEFPETGDRAGWGKIFRHKMENKDHHVSGLYNAETGEQLVKGPDMRNAISKGYIKPKKKKEENKPVSSNTRAKMRFQDVELDPGLWVLFDLARLRFPDEYEDTPGSFADWVTETIYSFYIEHADELGFDQLLSKSIENILAKGDKSWELPA